MGALRMSDLKEIKQAIVNYGLHSSFVREMLKTWPLSNKATTHHWAQLTSDILESSPQLHFRCLFKEETRLLQQQKSAKGTEISLDQILGENQQHRKTPVQTNQTAEREHVN